MRRPAGGLIAAAGALALLLLAPGAALAQAKAPALKVERIDVARAGTYEIEVGKPIPDARVATGNRVEAKAYKSLKVGAKTIPARLGTVIGAELTIVGAPRRGKVPLKVVWRYPEPGLVNPESKSASATDEYNDTQLVGEKFPIIWGLTQEWHLMPGDWTLEVWHGERKLVTQVFTLVKP
jgi:hypothetical protein